MTKFESQIGINLLIWFDSEFSGLGKLFEQIWLYISELVQQLSELLKTFANIEYIKLGYCNFGEKCFRHINVLCLTEFVKTDIHQSVTTREVMEGANSQHSVSTVTKKKRMSVKIMKTFKIWERSCKKKSYRSPI